MWKYTLVQKVEKGFHETWEFYAQRSPPWLPVQILPPAQEIDLESSQRVFFFSFFPPDCHNAITGEINARWDQRDKKESAKIIAETMANVCGNVVPETTKAPFLPPDNPWALMSFGLTVRGFSQGSLMVGLLGFGLLSNPPKGPA